MATRFLLKLLLFLAMIAISMQSLFVIARKFERPYFEDSTFAWVNHLPVKPKILLMGSSTVLNNLSPREIAREAGLQPGEVINFGGGSRGALQMYHVWQTIAPSRDSVRVVLFSLDPWIAYQAYYWIEDFPTLYWNPVQRLYPILDGRWARYVMSGAVVTDVLKKSAIHTFHWQTPNLAIPHDFGGEILDIHLKNYREHTREYFGPVSLFPISQLYLDRLRELKESVERAGADFVILLPPKKSVWVEEYGRNCSDIDSDFVHHVSLALGSVKVIGSFHLFPKWEEDSLFMDHVHLSGAGERRLSDFVGEEILRLKNLPSARLRSLLLY